VIDPLDRFFALRGIAAAAMASPTLPVSTCTRRGVPLSIATVRNQPLVMLAVLSGRSMRSSLLDAGGSSHAAAGATIDKASTAISAARKNPRIMDRPSSAHQFVRSNDRCSGVASAAEDSRPLASSAQNMSRTIETG
jgi:hypothetical protein